MRIKPSRLLTAAVGVAATAALALPSAAAAAPSQNYRSAVDSKIHCT